MSAYVDPRFRPTLWPGTVIPAPPLRPFGPREIAVEGDWITWRIKDSRGTETSHLPSDFYLRELMDLSADDLDGVAETFSTYGMLFDLDGRDLNLNDYDEPERQAIVELTRLDPCDDPWLGGVHRDLVKVHLQTAQEAVATWLACQREGGLEELVEPEVTDEKLAFFHAQNPDSPPWPHSLDHLRDVLIDFRLTSFDSILESALSRFSIGVSGLADRNPTIYSVAFLQLYNHLAEEASVRRCANDNCGRNFVRQRGRAEYGQHRTTGVKYCSRECARAQAQRDLRRRRRATTT
ncbi:hypothetical protein ACFYUY_33395 [Kitasatospora sp. NPDC004745]|uniref:hypothetical protein n=1 Tax=Kitasatospora sp. NPDC004745 TaxID=3364019 RepID=UPI0036BFB272